jgi:hypothetical protein
VLRSAVRWRRAARHGAHRQGRAHDAVSVPAVPSAMRSGSSLNRRASPNDNPVQGAAIARLAEAGHLEEGPVRAARQREGLIEVVAGLADKARPQLGHPEVH